MKQVILLSLLLIAPIVKGQSAKFPGGMDAFEDFIFKNYRTPSSVKDSSLSGIIHINFIIFTDGNMDSIKIAKNELNKDCADEMIRVLKLVALKYKWIPGQVNTRFMFPIAFEEGIIQKPDWGEFN